MGTTVKEKVRETPEEKKERRKREKQLRAKLRRQVKTRDVKLNELYGDHPVEEWDEEELARGRPRCVDGSFRGREPSWVSRQTHEEAVRRFTDMAQGNMRALVPEALRVVEQLLTSNEVDEKGRPLVPAAVRADVAKWTVEHLIGKPTARTELDISVKLQGILANVIVSGSSGEPGLLELPSWEEEEDETSEVGE